MRDYFNGIKLSPDQITNHQIRLDAVLGALEGRDISTVCDVGCGDGQLIEKLLSRGLKVIGIEPDQQTFSGLAQKFAEVKEVALFNDSLFTISQSVLRCDAVTLVEVIEHISLEGVENMSEIIFKDIHPSLVVITTPNAITKDAERMRKLGHLFEWSQEEFAAWAENISSKYGYKYSIKVLTGPTFKRGTQVGVFERSKSIETPLDPDNLKKRFNEEGFARVFEWHDEPNTAYEEHSHKGKVSFYVVHGSVTFSGGISQTIQAGERFDVPVGVAHSAVVGPEGCDWIVGEEIEGDS